MSLIFPGQFFRFDAVLNYDDFVQMIIFFLAKAFSLTDVFILYI